MKHAGGLAIALMVSGCIAPARPVAPAPVSTDAAEAADLQRIDPEMQTLFDEQPVWESRPVEPNATRSAGGRYTVMVGDTFSGIGEKTGAGSEPIAKANGLIAPFTIKPGQMLTIPEGFFHRVSPGETGIAIARAYMTPWGEIVALNGLTEPYTLRIGQRLQLPVRAKPGEPVTVQSVDNDYEARAAAFRIDIDSIITGGEPAVEPATDVKFGNPASLPPTTAVAAPAQSTGGFFWPATGKLAARFGPAGEGEVNQGIELDVARRAEIRASGDGVIAFVGDKVAVYGGVILIRHGNGWITTYGRVAEALVTQGQNITRGQSIGYSGSGAAPRLFFQIRKNRVPVDPLKHLPPR